MEEKQQREVTVAVGRTQPSVTNLSTRQGEEGEEEEEEEGDKRRDQEETRLRSKTSDNVDRPMRQMIKKRREQSEASAETEDFGSCKCKRERERECCKEVIKGG